MRCVRFSGLRSYLERLLDDIALGASGRAVRGAAVGPLVQRTADRLNYAAERDGLTPDQLTAESRELLGWFRYFAVPDRFTAYLEAVNRALPVFTRKASESWRDPLLVHFRPTSSLYRWRASHDGTRILLPTPMIVLSNEQLDSLAGQMSGRTPRDCVSRAVLTPEYRRVAADLSAAGGVADRTAGEAHDLLASFARVNGEYFDGQCERPRLTWGERDTFRKFGHYDFVQDLVMLSRSLDAPQVPTFVIDHVMHHELLHKKHGIRWQWGRRQAHMPEFRREERRFRHYQQADQFLEGLSRQLRCTRC